MSAVLLASCASMPSRYSVSESQLTERLAAQLSTPQRWLGIVDVQLSNPRVTAEPAQDRLRAAFDVQAGQGDRAPRFQARVAVLAGVRYEPSDHSLRLRGVTLEAEAEAEAPQADHGGQVRWGRLVSGMVGPLLEDVSIYRLPAARAQRLRDEGLAIRDVRVTSNGLQFTLGPVR